MQKNMLQPAHNTDTDREEENLAHTSESENPTGLDIDMEINVDGTRGGAVKKSIDFLERHQGQAAHH
jgi:hypothetical protein